MTPWKWAAVATAALLSAYALGRYTAPEVVKEIIHTIVIEKEIVDKHKETEIIEHPDGSKETKIIEDYHKTTDKSADSESSKESIRSASKVTVAALYGAQASLSATFTPVYGLSISKPILGPFTVGAFGFSSGVVGLSVGLTF